MAFGPPQHQCQGTVFGPKNPMGQYDAVRLDKDITSKDLIAIFALLCHRSNSQRQRIRYWYQTKVHAGKRRTLDRDLYHLADRVFHPVVTSLIVPPDEFTAAQLHRLLRAGKVELVAETLMTFKSNKLKSQVIAEYINRNRETLADAVKKKILLPALVSNERSESLEVNRDNADADAAAIRMDGVDNWIAAKSAFARIFSTQNQVQLQEVIRSYEAQYREEIAVTIDRSTAATSTKKLLLTIVKVMKNRPAYFAEQIQTALVESDGTELLRLIVSRCEIDMRQIKMAYRKRFRNQLEDQIERLDNLLPHYKNVLKALVVGD